MINSIKAKLKIFNFIHYKLFNAYVIVSACCRRVVGFESEPYCVIIKTLKSVNICICVSTKYLVYYYDYYIIE